MIAGPRRIAAAVVIPALALTFGACSKDKKDTNAASTNTTETTSSSTGGSGATGATTGGSTPATGNAITIKSFTFSPESLTVPAGATVTVTNNDAAAHTVTDTAATAAFDQQVDGNANTTFKAPSKAGTYSYHCRFHPNMKGTLVVQ